VVDADGNVGDEDVTPLVGGMEQGVTLSDEGHRGPEVERLK